MLLQVTLYRRMQPDLPERSWAGPCGMSVMERLLVTNHGKDGAVFYVSTLLPHQVQQAWQSCPASWRLCCLLE